MDEFASNSDKSREMPVPEKVVTKVATGAKKKKTERSSFAELFLPEDMNEVKRYVLTSVIGPSIKRAVYDIATKSLERFLNTSGISSSSSVKPSYSNYYDNRSSSPARVQTSSAYSFDDVLMNTRADAEEVLRSMNDILATYHAVTVADMYDLAGVVANYTDNKYGWRSLSGARVEMEKDGYRLALPRPIAL